MLNLFSRRPSRRLAALRGMALFADLTRRELRAVEGFMHERRYVQGEVIFDQGEEGEAFYVVLEGEVLIAREHASDPLSVTMHKGEFFGELALLDNAPRSAQARAAADCMLLVLFRGDFMGLMESHGLIASKIAMQLARYLGERLRNAAQLRGVSL
jgi:CRP-like cAMP-binding protein